MSITIVRVPSNLLLTLLLISPLTGFAQSPFKGLENLFTVPKNYIAGYVKTPPLVDGDINDAVWRQAEWTDDFEDIEGELKPKPPLQTRTKMLWDDSCIYIAAELRDPQVWATLKRHDEVIFHDNDFEVFIDPGNTTRHYFEIEYNALNTVFDLFLSKPYRDGGIPRIDWDAEGLRSAVKVQGTLNDPSDTDEGWTIEMAIPFRALSNGNTLQIPKEGALWRINFSRVEWGTKVVDGKYVKLKDAGGKVLPEYNWVWSPQGVVNMHYPERWGYLQFSKDSAAGKTFTLPYAEQQKRYLWLIYYHEKEWFQKHHTYTNNLNDFQLDTKESIEGKTNTLQMEATANQFMAFISSEDGAYIISINQEGLCRVMDKNK